MAWSSVCYPFYFLLFLYPAIYQVTILISSHIMQPNIQYNLLHDNNNLNSQQKLDISTRIFIILKCGKKLYIPVYLLLRKVTFETIFRLDVSSFIETIWLAENSNSSFCLTFNINFGIIMKFNFVVKG